MANGLTSLIFLCNFLMSVEVRTIRNCKSIRQISYPTILPLLMAPHSIMSHKFKDFWTKILQYKQLE